MRVTVEVLSKAMQACDKAFGGNAPFRWTPYHTFGITNKQWARYMQTKKLKVSPATAEKLWHASVLNSPHARTLFKVIEARHRK